MHLLPTLWLMPIQSLNSCSQLRQFYSSYGMSHPFSLDSLDHLSWEVVSSSVSGQCKNQRSPELSAGNVPQHLKYQCVTTSILMLNPKHRAGTKKKINSIPTETRTCICRDVTQFAKSSLCKWSGSVITYNHLE